MSRLSPDTKISELIRQNKDAIEAIVLLSPAFKKLRNPILRRLMAPRVSIAEAAKIGKCSIEDFKQALAPYGFEFEDDASGLEKTMSHNPEREISSQFEEKIPTWLIDVSPASILNLDVRQQIEDGNDPLSDILKSFRDLKEEQILCIINSFIPYPLIRVLEKKNALWFVKEVKPAEFHTFFKKDQPVELNYIGSESDQVFVTVDHANFLKIMEKISKGEHRSLDVRDLPMPQPMENILETLADMRPDENLFVMHKRIPLFLLEALEEMEDFDREIIICEVSDKEVKMLFLSKAKA